MKHVLLTFTLSLFLSFPFLVVGQNSLTRMEMLPYGSMFSLTSSVNFNTIDTTINGSNAVWDFSTLQASPSGEFLDITIVDPATTPNGASFPNANYAYEESPATAYRYFHLNDSVMERLGSFSATRGLNTYSDPQIEYVFPLALGTQNNDTWSSTASSFGGSYNLRCVGEGQLILPGATYDRVLMVYVELEELFTTPVYFWYSADNGAILLQYVVGDGLFIGTQLRYLTSLSVATGIEDDSFISHIEYQNPISDNLRIYMESEQVVALRYTLINTKGQVLLNESVSDFPGQTHEFKVDVQELTQGMYYLTLFNQNNPREFRTVKLIKN